MGEEGPVRGEFKIEVGGKELGKGAKLVITVSGPPDTGRARSSILGVGIRTERTIDAEVRDVADEMKSIEEPRRLLDEPAPGAKRIVEDSPG